MTARAVKISRVTASGSGMCGVLAFVLFFINRDCGSWRYKTKKILLRIQKKRTQKQAQKDMNEME